ncbi:MAG: glycoside hydrolase family 3 protein [Elusimicrobiaceae bacterium]|nr:glycoside hydrolase family 3 protein [Elusimicrobiaceae bacterium]
MKKYLTLTVLLASVCAFALPAANELSTRELVGQTIMPRVVIGHHQVFKEPLEKGEITGFFVKASEGLTVHPVITLKNQDKFLAKQRKKLMQTLRDLNTWASKNPRQIPLLLGFDYEGGTVTSPMFMGLKQMPSNMLLAATQDPLLIGKMYAQQAAEIKRVGGNMALGPDADVNSNPANPIIQTRSFGDNAAQVGRYAAVAVVGLQTSGVPGCVKHYPGHGDTASDSHYSQPITNLPEKELWDTHISAFVPAIEKGVWGVMTNHVVYPQIDAENSSIFSRKIIQDILRDKIGFNGLVMTDGLDMGGTNGKPIKDVVLDGFAAGNDVLLLTGSVDEIEASAQYPGQAAIWVEEDLQQARPRVDQEELVKSVQRVLDLKQFLARNSDETSDESEFARVSRRVAEKGVTLIRDTQNFPSSLQKASNVCVVMFADGIFSKQVHAFAEVFKKQGKKVKYVQTPRTPSADADKKIKSCMRKADVVVVGTSATSSLQPDQFEKTIGLLRQAQERQLPFALVSLLNPYEIPSYPEAKTVVALYGPTIDTTTVAAEILSGLRTAQGVLPITLPENILLPFEKIKRATIL